VEKYIHDLFEDINPIRDIAGEKMYITISDIKITEPQQDIEECKRKELTYG
jgi:DNA-directed RNA polymerase beta subunit